jgi:hypothetical protein
MVEHLKYKWFYTSSGNLVVGGKSAAQNDELIKELKRTGKEYIAMHTENPGSPFTFIITEPEKVSKQDRIECAIFTGCFSQAWKSGTKDALIDVFRLSQLTKRVDMKTGTWGVNGYVEKIEAPLKLVLTRQKGVLRAVPKDSVKKKSEIILLIEPGNIEKNDLLLKLEVDLGHSFNREEVLAALPAGGIRIAKN